jgi:glycine hydroxymethyltransferase
MSVMTRVDPALADVDPEIAALIGAEQERQSAKIRLIPSENYV